MCEMREKQNRLLASSTVFVASPICLFVCLFTKSGSLTERTSFVLGKIKIKTCLASWFFEKKEGGGAFFFF